MNIMLKMGEEFRMRRRGFTLLELVIVIAIIGIFTAIAIPSIGSAVENSKYLKDVQNADLMSKALDAAHISFVSSRDIDMESIVSAIVGAGFSVKTESEDAVFVYVRQTGNIYAVKKWIQGNYDSRYQKYAQVTFQDAEGKTLYGYVLDPESDLITAGSGDGTGGLQSISFDKEDFLYLERRVTADAEKNESTEENAEYELRAIFSGLPDEESENIRWESSDEAVVSVCPDGNRKQAKISVIGAGTAVITVSVKGYGCYAQCVICTDIRPSEIRADIMEAEGEENQVSIADGTLMWRNTEGDEQEFLPVGTEFTFDAKGIYTYGNGEEEVSLAPSDEGVEFGVSDSSDSNVVEIDPETGKVKIVGAGEAVITIKSKYKSSNPEASETEEAIVKEINIAGYVPLDSVQIETPSSETENIRLIPANNSETGEVQNAVMIELSKGEDEEYLPVELAFTAIFNDGASCGSVSWECKKDGISYFSAEGANVKLTISEAGIYLVSVTAEDAAGKSMSASYMVYVIGRFQAGPDMNSDQQGLLSITAGFGTPATSFSIMSHKWISDLSVTSVAVRTIDVKVARENDVFDINKLIETQINEISVGWSTLDSEADTCCLSSTFQIPSYDGSDEDRIVIVSGDKILLPLDIVLSYTSDETVVYHFTVSFVLIVEMKQF